MPSASQARSATQPRKRPSIFGPLARPAASHHASHESTCALRLRAGAFPFFSFSFASATKNPYSAGFSAARRANAGSSSNALPRLRVTRVLGARGGTADALVFFPRFLAARASPSREDARFVSSKRPPRTPRARRRWTRRGVDGASACSSRCAPRARARTRSGAQSARAPSAVSSAGPGSCRAAPRSPARPPRAASLATGTPRLAAPSRTRESRADPRSPSRGCFESSALSGGADHRLHRLRPHRDEPLLRRAPALSTLLEGVLGRTPRAFQGGARHVFESEGREKNRDVSCDRERRFF